MRKLLAVLLIFVLLFTGCASVPEPEQSENPEEAPQEEVLQEEAPKEEQFVFTRENMPRLDGSTSMVPLGQAVASVLLGETAEEVTDLLNFHRTTESFHWLMEGESDLLLVAEPNAVVFEEMEQQEFKYEMQPIAKEALVFFVNSENPVDSLTVAELQKIYTGEITNWSEVGGDNVEIIAFQTDDTSASQVLMDKLVMGDLEMMEAPDEWISTDWIASETYDLMDGVRGYEDSASSIGYSVCYYAEDMRMAEGMKIISVDGIEPADETIGNETYPLINPYFAVISAEANEPTRVLYDWLVSADGQMVLEQQGYVPVNSAPAEPVITGVQMDLSKLETFEPVEEMYTRRYAEKTEDLIPGDYGMLRPFVGSRAVIDTLSFGSSRVCNGNMGLIDETGAIVVDAVYADICLLTDEQSGDVSNFWRLGKAVPKEYKWGSGAELSFGFCTLDGSVAEPCIYESIQYQNGYLVAVENSAEGLFRIYDSQGKLLMDSACWAQKPTVYRNRSWSGISVSDHLLSIVVQHDAENAYDGECWLCDWYGNIISKEYGYVLFDGEGPYDCNIRSGGACYIDQYGNLLSADYELTSEYLFGRAVVRRGGAYQVVDKNGAVLWQPDVTDMKTCLADTTVYYQVPYRDNSGTNLYQYYNSDFELLYPEADQVKWLVDDWFLVCKDDVLYLDNGQKSSELEGAVSKNVKDYHSNENALHELRLISKSDIYQSVWWLYDRELNPLVSCDSDGEYATIKVDLLGDGSVATAYKEETNPEMFRMLDYEGAPKLKDVGVIAIYDGWYMVEDTFSAGYMDKDGNWLFRVSLMDDMTD